MSYSGYRTLTPSRAAKFSIRSNDDLLHSTAPLFARSGEPDFVSIIKQINSPNVTPWASFSRSREISVEVYGLVDSSGSQWATPSTPSLLFEVNLDLSREDRYVVDPALCAKAVLDTWELRNSTEEHREAVKQFLQNEKNRLLGGELRLLTAEHPFSFADDTVTESNLETAIFVSEDDQEFLVAGGVFPQEIVNVERIPGS